MLPTFTINYLAILACAIVAMPVGFLWFGPLFGKAWQREMGFGTHAARLGIDGQSDGDLLCDESPRLHGCSRTASRRGRRPRGDWRLMRRRGFTRSTALFSTGSGSSFRCR